ncbi:hypothetical protein EMIT0111MI5_10774 [Burkholderia sp. IT-111MI5]
MRRRTVARPPPGRVHAREGGAAGPKRAASVPAMRRVRDAAFAAREMPSHAWRCRRGGLLTWERGRQPRPDIPVT